MIVKNKQPATEPYGLVNQNEPFWKENDVMVWNPRLEMFQWDHTEIDREHYVEFINGKYEKFSKDTCRICRQKITPYKTKYYQRQKEDGFKISVLFSAENCYCEKCARDQAMNETSTWTGVAVVKREQREEFGSGEYLEQITYADGSTASEMSYDEKMRAGLI